MKRLAASAMLARVVVVIIVLVLMGLASPALAVVQRLGGDFWTGFQMSPAQAQNVFLNASLGGG